MDEVYACVCGGKSSCLCITRRLQKDIESGMMQLHDLRGKMCDLEQEIFDIKMKLDDQKITETCGQK